METKVVWVEVRMISSAEIPIRVGADLSDETAAMLAEGQVSSRPPDRRLGPGSPRIEWQYHIRRDPRELEKFLITVSGGRGPDIWYTKKLVEAYSFVEAIQKVEPEARKEGVEILSITLDSDDPKTEVEY